ncbi:hypothetical protein [Bradyrhizobium sp. CCBAU 11361]|uniref:hypothetical protein n=1 Tax=Bradyrhizobium sp. CCBAU 11361 TaxID=1630812 RepID=UPI002305E5AF|nr:hypothetical protein [Bradyrhizobium sp. CCBAU 11361]
MRRIFHFVFAAIGLQALIVVSASRLAEAQTSQPNDPLLGTWQQDASGNQMEFKPGRNVVLSFTGPGINAVSGSGTYETLVCSAAGANLCIEAPQFKCSFRYSINGSKMNLQVRAGNQLCDIAKGDYQKQP